MVRCLPKISPIKLIFGVLIFPVVLGLVWMLNVEQVGNKEETGPSQVTRTEPVVEPEPDITLVAGGDVMLGRSVEIRLKKYGVNWPFENIKKIISSADWAWANLESPFRTDAASTISGSLVLRGYPEAAPALKWVGLDMVTLANNHIPDMGSVGLVETQSLLTAQGVKFAGAGENEAAAHVPVIAEIKGVKYGFLSYTYGVNFDRKGVYYAEADPAQAKVDLAKLKDQVDVSVVAVHFGNEYQAKASAKQVEFTHACIDAGATMVIGGHPHVPQPVEVYQGGLIIYSLGNLVFDQEPIDNRIYSALAKISMKGSKLTSLELVPYQIHDLAQPVLLTNQSEKERIWKLFDLPTGQLTFN